MPVLTVNVAEVEPCGTVTLEGTLAAVVLELESATATPPVPAGCRQGDGSGAGLAANNRAGVH